MRKISLEEQVWKFLRGKGLPEKSVAAAMGNIQAESMFDPKLVEVGGGGGFGLIQWTGSRNTQLKRYGTSVNHQLNFLWAELTGVGITAMGGTRQWIQKSGLNYDSFMQGEGSLTELTTSFMRNFLRPLDIESSSHLRSRRIPKANEYFTQFTGIQGEYTPGAVGGEGGSQGSSQGLPPLMEVTSTNFQVVKGSEKYGDYLFGRRYRITISSAKGETIDVSDLHCKFSILKTMQMEPNVSEIDIYNLSAQTENAIKTEGTRVTVEAGYEGSQFGLIFDGDIIQCIQGKEESHTYKLTIIALDSDKAINFEIANFSILRGQSHREIVENIVSVAKNPMKLGSISDKLNEIKLTRGKVFLGKTSDYLEQIAKSNDLQFYMEDGRVNLIDLKEMPKDEIIKLGPQSGLIGVPEQTDFGIDGTCLLNPSIKINSLIHVENHLIRERKISFGVQNTIPMTSGGSADETPVSGAAAESGGQPSKGGYLIPYNGKFPITSPYGMRGSRMHNGIDIGTPTGTPMYASKSGTVLKAGIDSAGLNAGGGKIVMLSHPDGSATNYFHLSKWSVETGATVKQGQLIGYSGNTGFSSGPHLHFEIKEGGKYKNPASVINGGTGETKPPSVPSVEEANNQDNTSPLGGSTTSSSMVSGEVQHVHSLIRPLDKDGIYRIIKIEYQGDTRGGDWYAHFSCLTQTGNMIPSISS